MSHTLGLEITKSSPLNLLIAGFPITPRACPNFLERKKLYLINFFYDKISQHSITLHFRDLNIVKSPWWNHPYSLRAFQATSTKLWFQRSQHNKTNTWCVTLWPCHLLFKVSCGKWRIMETQNISPCKKIQSSKNPLKQTKILQDIIITL